ncbi:unnamed protein product [Cylicocyclus nassatus]|uniref:guanylate cyclase n=1 Tax=Cylicocyclus nassatus TaxID=53992 RepID=A0AA36M8B8_CYLNA|nr:unnamed protein product [Cylicocyclus nassatus]
MIDIIALFYVFMVTFDVATVSGDKAEPRQDGLTQYAGNADDTSSLYDDRGKMRIKVGHIGALGALRNDDVILNISRKSLISEKILDDEFDLEFISQNGCGESYEGVAVAADMYHLQKVKVFIGPYCGAEMDAVARMAAFWNVPVIGYMAAANSLSDKKAYPTLARVSLRTTNSIAEATAALLRHYGWKKVAIVTNTGTVAYDRSVAFEAVFHAKNITVTKKDGAKDVSPWIGPDGAILQKVKDQYANSIIIDDVNSFDNSIIGPFLERIKVAGLTEADVDLANIYGYLYLFDAVKLYALTAKKVMNETGDSKNLLNGRLMWNAMRRMKFDGMLASSGVASGIVTMDDIAERAPLYRGFFVSPNSDQVDSKVLSMVHMEPTMIPNCDGLRSKSGCYEIVVTDMMREFWPSADKRMPKDEPECGFRGERCDFTLLIVGGALMITVLLFMCGTYFLHKFLQKKALDKLTFRIYRDEMQFIDEEQLKSMLSLGSTRTKMSNANYGTRNHAIVGTNTHAIYHKYPQRRPITFNRTDKKLLCSMKQAVHDNTNPFLGICFNEKEEVLIVWKFCSRGSLQDIIYNDNIALDQKFHGAFIRDILNGLEYLHASIGYHGALSTWSCLIDRSWMIKLTDYGIADAVERWENEQAISVDALKGDDDKTQATQATSALYEAPELLKNREKNRGRRMDQDWSKQTQGRRQLGDIYGLGVIMYEIIFRALPFPDGTDISVLVENIKNGSKITKPSIQDNKVLNMDLSNLISDCWNKTPEMRPTLRRIKLNVETYLKVKGSLVDQMMRMMEQYANNLEKLVQERTGMLEEANIRADKLLSQLLPAYVAKELKFGRPVPPKSFTSATVLFSDIVEFSDMCKNATPLQVVNVLNGVFDGFDQFIARRDAYKVETIGDAYMVVSGVPEENGHRHINEIASIALDIHKFLTEFEIPHQPGKRVVCRLGFHTGPVAAAVVGMNAPRYCLFGDAVNMSSRMGSNGAPGRTQISEAANTLLMKEYPEYETELRGEIPIKGKGMCNTYWLNGVKRTTSNAYLAPSAKGGNNFGGLLGSSGSASATTSLKNPTGSMMSKVSSS